MNENAVEKVMLVFNDPVYKSHKNTWKNIYRWTCNINPISLSAAKVKKKTLEPFTSTSSKLFSEIFVFFGGMKPARSYRSTASIQQL